VKVTYNDFIFCNCFLLTCPHCDNEIPYFEMPSIGERLECPYCCDMISVVGVEEGEG